MEVVISQVNTPQNTFDVLIFGAGVAGLTAAHALASAGRRVAVLEAGPQPGGRLRTVIANGTPIELGAEFIHGRPPELLEIIANAGLPIVEGVGDDLTFYKGSLDEDERDEDDGAAQIMEGMEAVAARTGDMSFDLYLDQVSAPPEDRARIRSYVEGFNAADASKIGILGLARQQKAENAIEGDRVARLEGGYTTLVQTLAHRATFAGVGITLETPVTRIDWNAERCIVDTANGQSWQARRVIVSVPLGVLQAGTIQFTPRPAKALEAANALAFGPVQRWTFQFHTRFWAEAHPQLRFLFVADQAAARPFAVWWAPYPQTHALLTGWAAGPRALGYSWSDREAVIANALSSLATIFNISRETIEREFRGAHTHDWQADPLFRGAYSYAPAGAALCYETLSQPVENTLFFAGEHTDVTGHPGTVHGAYRSGLRAAAQVLATF